MTRATRAGLFTPLLALVWGCVSGGPPPPAPCREGLTRCASSCVDLRSDARACGSCGVVCGETEMCVAGACTCPDEHERCGGECVHVASDPANCGRCSMG